MRYTLFISPKNLVSGAADEVLGTLQSSHLVVEIYLPFHDPESTIITYLSSSSSSSSMPFNRTLASNFHLCEAFTDKPS
jgi:hypothetical protein